MAHKSLEAYSKSIQAGLFSAVNTAFIVVTLVELSAGPSDETNQLLRLLILRTDNSTFSPSDVISSAGFTAVPSAVPQNCVFFASLCSSLLAATGAVLAKQWLLNYERTGQSGSPGTQGLLRTEKFLRANRWALKVVVDILPTLLLMSLALFFIALADYLWTINRPVALVVLAFAAAGAVGYSFASVAAAIDRYRPFQTSVAYSIRTV